MVMPDPETGGPDPEPADASLLFQDDEAPARPGPSPLTSATGGEATYDLEAGAAPNPSGATRPAAPEAGRAAGKARNEAAASVDQVWTRGAEWGPTLAVLGVVGALFATLIVLTFSGENIGLTLVLMLLGGGALLLLAYPIAVTLERPVRMTPEHAVRDFYGALAHHVPHYRRMWLLLSSAGRTSSSYGSLEGFKAYWKARLAALRGNGVGSFTPLVFEIQDFKAEKSAGKTAISATYTLNISARGQRSKGPLATVPIRATFARGPDNQWYLNEGTLP